MNESKENLLINKTKSYIIFYISKRSVSMGWVGCFRKTPYKVIYKYVIKTENYLEQLNRFRSKTLKTHFKSNLHLKVGASEEHSRAAYGKRAISGLVYSLNGNNVQ